MESRTNATLLLEIDRLDARTLEITARGSLDESTVPELRAQGLGRGDDSSDRLLVDLSGLDQIDAAGLAVLLLARIEIEARGGSMAVFAPRSRVARILDRAGIPSFVDVAASRPAALKMLGL